MFRLEISHSCFSTRSGALDLTIGHIKKYVLTQFFGILRTNRNKPIIPINKISPKKVKNKNVFILLFKSSAIVFLS